MGDRQACSARQSGVHLRTIGEFHCADALSASSPRSLAAFSLLRFFLCPQVPPPKKQKTLDNTREHDETLVAADDEEVQADESIDEFSKYFQGEVEPKIIITSCYKPSKAMYDLIRDLLYVFPNSFYYKRQKFTIKQIVEAAKKRDYTDLLIINEDKKKFNALTHVHLPEGPTAYYKLSNVVMCKDIEGQQREMLHE
jgi:ribosome production factor 1